MKLADKHNELIMNYKGLDTVISNRLKDFSIINKNRMQLAKTRECENLAENAKTPNKQDKYNPFLSFFK